MFFFAYCKSIRLGSEALPKQRELPRQSLGSSRCDLQSSSRCEWLHLSKAVQSAAQVAMFRQSRSCCLLCDEQSRWTEKEKIEAFF